MRKGDPQMSAGNPQSQPGEEKKTLPEETRKPEATVSTSGSETATEEQESSRFDRFMDKAQSIMPIWAWVVCVGIIMAILLSILAFFMMKTLDVGRDSFTGGDTTLSPPHPAATTTGKWDDAPEIGGGDGTAGSVYTEYYVPPAPAEPSTEEPQTSEPKPSSSKPKPSDSPKPEPSAPNAPTTSAPPAPSANPSPSPEPTPTSGGDAGTGNGGGNGTGNAGGNG